MVTPLKPSDFRPIGPQEMLAFGLWVQRRPIARTIEAFHELGITDAAVIGAGIGAAALQGLTLSFEHPVGQALLQGPEGRRAMLTILCEPSKAHLVPQLSGNDEVELLAALLPGRATAPKPDQTQ